MKTRSFITEHVWVVYVGLALATFGPYVQVINFGFTNYDDPYIVWRNPVVSSGLTLRGTYWALTTGFFDFWRPVTWLSHMLDCELFGLHGGLHRFMNVVYHTLGTLVLFHALRLMTGSVWRSALVAALFALHPLRVESVAWVAERKDVLSGLFGFLSLACYAQYVRGLQGVERASEVGLRAGNPGWDRIRARRWFWASALFFALGLMSKPALVTLPFVFLLLDFWPLKRIALSGSRLELTSVLGRLVKLVAEKVPFFGMSMVSSTVTYLVMKSGGNVLSSEAVPWALRLANVPVSYLRYLAKTFMPVNLAPWYPMPGSWPAWFVLVSVAILLLITVIVIVAVRAAPYLIVGWLWFIGMFVPTIGLVQMGYHSIADRYTYLPSVGLFLALVWLLGSVGEKLRLGRTLAAVLGLGVLGLLGALTWKQVWHWRDDVSLWSWCIAVTKNNPAAHYGLGRAYHELGQLDMAVEQYRAALELDPNHILSRLNLGVVLARRGRLSEATNHFGAILAREPKMVEALLNMGNALFQLKDYRGATNYFARALELVPGHPETHRTYAAALVELGDYDGAIAHAEAVIKATPGDVWAYVFKGRALSALGMSDEALNAYFTALNMNYDCAEAHYHLALEWLKRGRTESAVSSLREAVRIAPDWAEAHLQLGMALSARGERAGAIEHYRRTLERRPNMIVALNNLAWLLATAPEAQLRNGAEAVRLAERACALTGYQETIFVGTLAAAYAEAGEFDKAVETAERAAALAHQRGQTNLVVRNQYLIELFKARRAFREPGRPDAE
ncbi:MAG: tetratricopeptide repeat protein [Verrucomicrobiae bacterium]|nr:tetratricopeptide repeat protein [Verrucomicrobiae bacterium]